MSDNKEFEQDCDRGEAIVRKALLLIKDAYVPYEIILLVTLLEQRMNPRDGIVAAYLIGKGFADVQEASESARAYLAGDLK